MQPLLFTPYLRPMVWGNRRLGERLGKHLPDDQRYGESWDVSDHASHASAVANVPLAGTTLRDLMMQHRKELLGSAAERFAAFPWLVKFLDADDWLSVQVHPNDEQAKKWWPGEGGKTEVWFILEAAPGSRVYAGLLPGVDEKKLRAALTAGTVADCLHSFEPKPGDCVFLPAGTVHAVGGGVLMAEVQQTSDATFRLFDWNRVDAQGKSRELHIEQALACINWQQGPVEPIQANPLAKNQMLVRCPYFELEIRRERGSFDIGGEDRLQLLIPVDGHGSVFTENEKHALELGQVWLLPASMPAAACTADGLLTHLTVSLPD